MRPCSFLPDEPDGRSRRAGGRGVCAALEDDTTSLVSGATLLETALIIEVRKGEFGGREPDALIHKAEIVVVAVEAELVSEARRAYRRFGKGRHTAGSISGTSFASALARTSGEPLLFKGDDFVLRPARGRGRTRGCSSAR